MGFAAGVLSTSQGGFESGTKQPVIKNGYCTFEAKIRTLSVMTEAAKSRSFHLKPSLRLLGKNAKKKKTKKTCFEQKWRGFAAK